MLRRLARKPAAVIAVAAGMLLLTFALFELFSGYRATHGASPAIPKETLTRSTDRPDETPVSGDGYRVAADQPRQIRIPSIATQGFIQKVGVDQHQAIAVPGNVHLAGWYTRSARPGDIGVSILDGHLQGRYADGIFKHLSELKAGDEIAIEFGDGSWRYFVVKHVDSFTVEEASSEQFRQLSDVDRQLTLITCSGVYDRASRQYDRRVIVRASLTP